MTIIHHDLLTREGSVLTNGWTHSSSMTVFVHLFMRSVIQKVPIVTFNTIWYYIPYLVYYIPVGAPKSSLEKAPCNIYTRASLSLYPRNIFTLVARWLFWPSSYSFLASRYGAFDQRATHPPGFLNNPPSLLHYSLWDSPLNGTTQAQVIVIDSYVSHGRIVWGEKNDMEHL